MKYSWITIICKSTSKPLIVDIVVLLHLWQNNWQSEFERSNMTEEAAFAGVQVSRWEESRHCPPAKAAFLLTHQQYLHVSDLTARQSLLTSIPMQSIGTRFVSQPGCRVLWLLQLIIITSMIKTGGAEERIQNQTLLFVWPLGIRTWIDFTENTL